MIAPISVRYATSLAPPRNPQRHNPVAATVARRLPRWSLSTAIGREAPRRANRAWSTGTAPVSGGRSDTALAGGSESHAMPAR